jgi:predicted amidohydrolase
MASPKRPITIAAAQMGPNHLSSTRDSILDRMCSLLQQAATQKVNLIVYPELAFNTFFPRYLLTPEKLSEFFEIDDPSKGGIRNSPGVKRLFDLAHELNIDVSVGYAERNVQPDGSHVDYNSNVYYSAEKDGIAGKYRKVHLPGAVEPYTTPGAFQQLEKRYFKPGDLGFQAFRAPGLVKDALRKEDLQNTAETTTLHRRQRRPHHRHADL